MIDVTLYFNYSEPNVVDKKLTEIGTFSGYFRDEVSVTDPVFFIESDNIALVRCNYAHIVYLGRYFYITGITMVRTGLWQFNCHVDVLKSYWDSIKNISAIIARQENLYNLYLDDDRFLVNAQRIYNTIAFPNRVASGSGDNNTSFILTLAGGVGDTVVEST